MFDTNMLTCRALISVGDVVTCARRTAGASPTVRPCSTPTHRRCVGRVTGTVTRAPGARGRSAGSGPAAAPPAPSSASPTTAPPSWSVSRRTRRTAGPASTGTITSTTGRRAGTPPPPPPPTRDLRTSSLWYLFRAALLCCFHRPMLCIRGTSHGPAVSSVRTSVTSRCSTKTAKRRITQTTPHDSTGSLVF